MLSAGDRIGRYEVVRPLGRGGMGLVVLANDPILERTVAIKVLETAAEDGGSRARILREARSASALNHPNICTVFEVGEDAGCAYIVMEHVDGRTVCEMSPIAIDDAVRFGVEAADALAHAHDRGIVHGDLKAANAIIAASGRLKIVDFGLARRLDRRAVDATTAVWAAPSVAGTPYAMAPEQIHGDAADQLSDVWALGVLLYEMIVGGKPFTSPHLAELFSSILRDAPAPLPGHIPDAIRDIVEKCLSKPRSQRYQRAADVRLVLEVAATNLRRRDRPPSEVVVAAGSPLPPPPIVDTASGDEFVGRTRELEQLEHAWTRAGSGRCQLLLLGGEPGIGKTRLALTFARTRANANATVLVGRSEAEALIPYQPFVEAITWYVRVCPDSDLRGQLEAAGGGAELAQLVPDLLRRQPGMSPVPPISGDGQRYRLFQAVAELLAAAAARHPLLLILDDLHWADKPTLLMLRHLVRAQQHAPLCIIGTYRESELDRTHPFAEILADLRRDPAVTRLSLKGLDETHVRQLVEARLGSNAADLVPVVADITDGNPFFLGEMLHHIDESRTLGRIRATGVVTVADLGLPEGVREVIGRRLSRASERCNRTLVLASVIGREFDVALLTALGDLPEDELLDALDEAATAQLTSEVPESRGRISFRHALIRETLYAELSSARRVRLHRRVGEAIERLAHGKPNPPLGDLAYHFFQAAPGGDTERAVDYATRAGDRAADGLAYEEASRFYDMALQALQFSDGPDSVGRRVDLHTRRARAFGALAQWALEKREVELALASLPPEQTERRAELVLLLAGAAFYLLDIAGVRRFATDGLQLAEQTGQGDLAADALGWIARCQQADGDLVGAIATDRASIARGNGRKGIAIYHGPLTLYLAGRAADAVAAGERAAGLARTSRDSEFRMYGLSSYALALSGIGRYAEAHRVFDEVREFGLKHGVLPPLARAISMQAGLYLSIFDYEGAAALQTEALDLARSLAFVPTLVSASIDLLLTMARRLDPGSAEPVLSEAARLAAATPGWHEWLWRLRLTEARAELALARDEFDLAISEASEAIDQSGTCGRSKYEAHGLMTRAQAHHRRGRTRDAIVDARAAVDAARRTLDPALTLATLAVLLDLDGSDDLAGEARTLCAGIRAALPNEAMTRRFDNSAVVRQVK